jgi:hypothetical protein
VLRGWLQRVGERLADYLTRPRPGAGGAPVADEADWAACLRPGDVLLVDGASKVSTAIKYLTQSTWSHSALCVGTAAGLTRDGVAAELVEADMREGVRAVPAHFYAEANVRICRPVDLAEDDRTALVAWATEALGRQYDLRNVIDLARYLLPEPPVPTRWRGRLLALGSGEPTRAICSTLIAQAFRTVGYPILPERRDHPHGPRYAPRHHSFVTPRDFDLSPYFAIVKPTLEAGFDYRAFPWAAGVQPPSEGVPPGSASSSRTSR